MSKKKAVWTVMVYLAGDNNLTAECLFALTEMKKASPGKRLNVIAQFDPRDEFIPTHRYEINRYGPKSSIFDDIIDEARYDSKTGETCFRRESKRAQALAQKRAADTHRVNRLFKNDDDLSALEFVENEPTDDTDTGAPSALYNFLSFCIEEYPAEHYLVVLSGHSGGVESDYLLKDDSSKGSLTFNEMKQVFRQLKNDLHDRPIDIVGMDSCLMSMCEICYELRELVDIVIGCESFSPASGWPYREIIQRLKHSVKAKQSSKVKVAAAIVEEYVNYYSAYWLSGMSVSQSALDVRRVSGLREHIDKLARVMEKELRIATDNSKQRSFKDDLVLAHWEAQSYNGERFIDLFDFCKCLERRTPLATVLEQCQETCRFISRKFVLKSCYSGATYQYSYGVSIYFPWSQLLPKYENLEFVQGDSGWLRFLKTYLTATRRLPRGSADQVAQMSSTELSDNARMTADRMTADRMYTTTPGNEISSMRNPPVVFIPDVCINDHKGSLKAQARLCGTNSR
ncbi:MAG TPA: clostripain-related cysteine peptidase [Pyrinomonadaceae bacterium]